MRITNVGDNVLILHQDLRIRDLAGRRSCPATTGLDFNGVPALYGNLALEATVDPRSADPEDPPLPAVECPEYGTPREILQRSRPTMIKCPKGRSSEDQEVFDHSSSDNPRPLDSASIADDDSMSQVATVVEALDDRDPGSSDILTADPAPVEALALDTVLADENLSGAIRVDQNPPFQEVQDPKVVTLKGDGFDPSPFNVTTFGSWTSGGSEVYATVFFTGYGERILGGKDAGLDPPDLGLYHPIWTFRNRMPFGLKNAPQIYQRTIHNAIYGFTRIPKLTSDLECLDVFEAGEPEDPGKPSVLGRRSYIDDILVPASNWDELCDRVKDLLGACDK
ncbi:LOW QUALITY PROTEIN: reverse transcriptase [Phytophthora megakarya]|uniref:Reverse transcriptase n=1 Tax=Phytophthora megakarya TaxID=4795 RepID=A0A225W423_9STRA|nr:LOW QUALITY PROTEIN: reverse transcriptase [Phytophthora megakarya]